MFGRGGGEGEEFCIGDIGEVGWVAWEGLFEVGEEVFEVCEGGWRLGRWGSGRWGALS